jgi:leucyl aminopeptidase (aminopeptidase T)
MSVLSIAAKNALEICMGLKPSESLLVIYDLKKKNIANSIFKEGLKICKKCKLFRVKEPKVSGEEPVNSVANEMLKYDVIMLVTSKSLSHTKARRDACKKGARIASMPGITKEMFVRTMQADYNVIEKRTNDLCKILRKGKIVRITSSKGTDITMSIRSRKPLFGCLTNKKGSFHNLPAGECCLAPLEGSTNGVFVVDASFLGKVDKPIKVVVKDGFAISISGGKVASKLKKVLDSVKDKNAYNIAELGIGTNEDEKVLGTAHIAVGNNISYGGKIDVPIHLDGVFRKPTIFVDKKKIMENGKLLI